MSPFWKVILVALTALIVPAPSSYRKLPNAPKEKMITGAEVVFRVGVVSLVIVGYLVVAVLPFVFWLSRDFSCAEALVRVGAAISALGAFLGAIGASDLRLTRRPTPPSPPVMARRAEIQDCLTLAGWTGVVVGAALAFCSLLMTPPEPTQAPQDEQTQSSARLESSR